MRGSILSLAVVALLVGGCASRDPAPRVDLIRHFQCDDGTTFSAEVTPALVRLYTVTGTIQLPRQRGTDMPVYTNGLRTVAFAPGGVVYHTVGARSASTCRG